MTSAALMRAWSAFCDIFINCDASSPKMKGQWISCSGASLRRNIGLIGGRAKIVRVCWPELEKCRQGFELGCYSRWQA
jgi:hypothetical protein